MGRELPRSLLALPPPPSSTFSLEEGSFAERMPDVPPRPDPLRSAAPPVVLFAFANSRQDLRYLPEEQRRIRAVLTIAEQSGLCEIVERANATAAEVLDVFQERRAFVRVPGPVPWLARFATRMGALGTLPGTGKRPRNGP